MALLQMRGLADRISGSLDRRRFEPQADALGQPNVYSRTGQRVRDAPVSRRREEGLCGDNAVELLRSRLTE